MKKKKLTLNELKVQSFITDEIDTKKSTIKGGSGIKSFPCTTNPTLMTRCFHCPPSKTVLKEEF